MYLGAKIQTFHFSINIKTFFNFCSLGAKIQSISQYQPTRGQCILERYQRLIKVISVGATRRICFYGKIQREFDYLTSSNHS